MIRVLFLEAFSSLMANKLRSFLTTLGMIIGVGAVILMTSLGQGAKLSIEQSIGSMGSNLIVVRATPHKAAVRGVASDAVNLSVEDAMAIKELHSVNQVSPEDNKHVQVIYKAKNWQAMTFGGYPTTFDIGSWKLEKGTSYSEDDVRRANNVVVIGQTVYKNLFDPGEDPVGQLIRLQNIPFRVIGLLKSKGQNLMGYDQDDRLMVPLTSAQKYLFGSPYPGMVRLVMVQAKNDQTFLAESEIESLLRQRRKVADGEESDFDIRNLTAIAQSASEAADTMSLLLGAIASISLLVGGIGIMNIMLVSVTERTREIGIRLAIGAKKRHILLQFILEAVILSLIGCLLGMAIGVGLAVLLNKFFGIPMVVYGLGIVLSIAVSFFIGVFFGVYPAFKASNLKPIEALRFQ